MPLGVPAPPPPPPMNMGYSSDGVDSGMESGSAGSVSEQRKQIQPVEEDDRSALMKQIQSGVSLKVNIGLATLHSFKLCFTLS